LAVWMSARGFRVYSYVFGCIDDGGGRRIGRGMRRGLDEEEEREGTRNVPVCARVAVDARAAMLITVRLP